MCIRDSPWGNGFAWCYDGDAADSIKARVKVAGGNVNALLRVSLSWFNHDDLDIHCLDADGRHISWANKINTLDVDMNANSHRSRTPVENLAWNYLADGKYEVFVHQYSKRESVDVGFEIEYAHGSDVRRLSYPKAVRSQDKVPVCVFHAKSGKVTEVTFNSAFVDGASSTEKWGVSTGGMVPVETVMLSPNYWGEQGSGNKHHLFMLKGCLNPDPVRGFFLEQLRGDLHQHRKVFEVLGAKLKAAPSESQLSGVGFSTTRRDRATLAVRKDGTIRTYNVQF
jgi:hypothetical protein